MDSTVQSPDRSDVRPAFRKPVNDAANRKYRRHSPAGASDSSSSGGSPRRERSPRTRMSDDRRMKDDVREFERDSGRTRSSRASDSHRHSDRQSYGNSQDYKRHDDYGRSHRHADEEDRSYPKNSRSIRESRTGARSDYAGHGSPGDKPRESWRNADKYPRERPESLGHRSRDREAETGIQEQRRNNIKDTEKSISGSRSTREDSKANDRDRRDDSKASDRDRHRDRETRGEKRDRHRSPGDYKYDHMSSHDELKGHGKDSALGRVSGANQLKLAHKSDNREDDQAKNRKLTGKETDKPKEKYARDQEEGLRSQSRSQTGHHDKNGRSESINDNPNSSMKKFKLASSEDEKTTSSSKQVQETAEKFTSGPTGSTENQVETAHDLNAAKIQAMKAAEAVNKNLVGGSYMSTDQKKKLLWGNKKKNVAEEPSSRWDLQLFADRERQEKFNKLMGVKGDMIPEPKQLDKDGNLQAEKREQLEMDLEKQYTAGLRRRDGRTVGLGL